MASATVDGFSQGLVTPVAGFLVAWLGGALGLRCTNRSMHSKGVAKAGWLALGSTSIGVGIWTMHFIAMLGFSVAESSVTYDGTLTAASLVVAVVVVGIGIFAVSYLGARRPALLTAGLLMGLGIAGMHYLGMAAMHVGSGISYSVPLVVLSVVIAVVAATAALWSAMSAYGFRASLRASLIFGVAVAAMHYTGMAALNVELGEGHGSHGGGGMTGTELLVPMLLGPAVFLVVAAAVVMFDPVLMLGEEWEDPDASPSSGGPAGRAGRRTAGRRTSGRQRVGRP
ncbi:MHYT domain-containing protein [Streptomyces sp. NPDC006435]|uniref:MHYT domain-containing protein n=1 Tax=Streptomyces sp. NPDC006435 TaxID=3154300 RepID=UPI0033A6AD8F